jgi:fimbrial chaperone protein
MALGLLLQAGRASASSFRVTPVRVELSKSNASALLTLLNESDEDLRFQISAFNWTQDAAGNVKLDPTQDITFFPALLSLKPGEERKVRVGTKTFATDVEKTYRIFFEQLPPLMTPTAPPQGAQVRILTKMGIPIFLRPDKAHYAGAISPSAVSGGKLTFQVRNDGNIHFTVTSLKVSAVGSDGAPVFERQMDGWYVLPSAPRSYELELPPADCRRIRSINITAETDVTDESLKPTAQIQVSPEACGSKSSTLK